MYVHVDSPSTDSTIRIQLNFQSKQEDLNVTRDKLPDCLPSSFILISRMGRNSFTLISKKNLIPAQVQTSPRQVMHKRTHYYVVVGPQSCSCRLGSGTHTHQIVQSDCAWKPCVHLLFVMQRILRMSTDDPDIMARTLPESKVDALITAYENSRKPSSIHSDIHNNNLPRQHSSILLNQTSLVTPKPIYPKSMGPTKTRPQTPQLVEIPDMSKTQSPESRELSNLTRGIKPMSRCGTDSGGATSETSESVVTNGSTSITSSTDSMENSTRCLSSNQELMVSHKACDKLGAEIKRRPQTAPQPEPPPRLKHTRAGSLRQVSSTTFRPIKDRSPINAGNLSPIQSGDASTQNSLKHNLCGVRPSCEILRQSDVASSVEQHPEIGPIFQHAQFSQFKPIASHPNLMDQKCSSSLPSASTEDRINTKCIRSCDLCTEPINVKLTGAIGCTSTDTPQCNASYHSTCYKIWSEEITLKEGSPRCPNCLNTTLSTMPPKIERSSFVRCNSQQNCVNGMIQSSHSRASPMVFLDEGGVEHKTPRSCSVPDVSHPIQPIEQLEKSISTNLKVGKLSSPTASCSNLYSTYPEYQNCANAFSLVVAKALAPHQPSSRRQWGLQQAAQITVHNILLARERNRHNLTVDQADSRKVVKGSIDCSREPLQRSTKSQDPDCLRVLFRLIQHLFDDPADVVFIDALRAFRAILRYLVCFDMQTQNALQRAISPLLRRLLRFVGGPSILWSLRENTEQQPLNWNHAPVIPENGPNGNTNPEQIQDCPTGEIRGQSGSPTSSPTANLHDRANLALVTLVELAKGQHGILAIGKDIGCANDCLPVCGLQHMVRFILSSAKFHATHLVGRLTLLEKLIRMDQTIPSDGCKQSGKYVRPVDGDREPSSSLARRHLCSSLVFARRHMSPPNMNPEIAVCYPHHYQLQQSRLWLPAQTPDGRPMRINQQAAIDNLYNMQLKASRIARNVFLSAAKALLTYKPRESVDKTTCWNSVMPNADAIPEFCPRDFIETEMNRTEAPLANWLRHKLSPLMYPNLVSSPDNPFITPGLTQSDAQNVPSPVIADRIPMAYSKTIESLRFTGRTSDQLERDEVEHLSSENIISNSPMLPPVPPPRRIQSPSYMLEQLDLSLEAKCRTQCVQVALEPAYDLVALSESGHYNTSGESGDDEGNGRSISFGCSPFLNEPTYGGRSLGSEAELQTEQTAVLRSALRRGSRSMKPLLPVPALSIVMDAFRSTNTLPSSDEYYEDVDWLRGPMLGHGAFSQCYQARDTRTGLLMAVKRIRLGGGIIFPVKGGARHPQRNGRNGTNSDNVDDQKVDQPANAILSTVAEEQLTEVKSEINIMLKLHHPNILRLFGAVYCAHRGMVDLFIEWMPGGSIASLLQQYGAFNESVTMAYGVQVVRGLAHLHKHGILHRDLKGANLLVDTTGSAVCISDFGACARLSGEQSVANQFQGQVIGTFSFMAPEVLRGETYGRACDIWSVGCCLVEMLSGKPPWYDAQYTNRYALMFAIASSTSPPKFPKEVSEDVTVILDACFSQHAPARPTASKLLTFRAFAQLTESIPKCLEDSGRCAVKLAQLHVDDNQSHLLGQRGEQNDMLVATAIKSCCMK